MGAFDLIDPMIRGGAIALFLLWIALLWRDHRAVLSARVTDKALGEVFGMRFPGTGLPGLELVGTFISADLGRTFAVCHGRGEGVVIELDVDVAGFDRVVATVDDPEAIVAELS